MDNINTTNTQDQETQSIQEPKEALKEKLHSLGFEQIQFEPKLQKRFIVKIENFPSFKVLNYQPIKV